MEKYKNKIIIIALMIIIPFLIVALYFAFRSRVVTKQSDSKSELPQININSSDVENINKLLSELYDNYTSDNKSTFNYEYQKYKDINSILITIEDYQEDTNEYITKYLSYNIDSKGNNLDNDELMEKLNYNFDSIYNQINRKLQKYYNDIISLGYLTSECDYNCFLKNKHNIKYLLENTVFVVENGQLVAYVNLYTNNASGDKKYFDGIENPYRIIINR